MKGAFWRGICKTIKNFCCNEVSNSTENPEDFLGVQVPYLQNKGVTEMSNTTRMIGKVSTSVGKNGSTYSATYLVAEHELHIYEPEIYDKALWAPGDCVVTSYTKEAAGPRWLVTINAAPREEGYGAFSTGNPNDFVEKSYDVSEVFFYASWWGVRKASTNDANSKLLNINGEPCGVGDFLFRNASKTNKGSADYSKSPFVTSGTELSTSIIDLPIRTMIYSCAFYSRNNINSFVGFTGVNGGFSSKCRPAEITPGKWKVIDQTLRNSKEKNGKVWVKVSRKMLLAPFNLKWDPDKNGGNWKW